MTRIVDVRIHQEEMCEAFIFVELNAKNYDCDVRFGATSAWRDSKVENAFRIFRFRGQFMANDKYKMSTA